MENADWGQQDGQGVSERQTHEHLSPSMPAFLSPPSKDQALAFSDLKALVALRDNVIRGL